MSFWRFVFRSLCYHGRINLALALGVAAATAVLTGALLVGDSVRGSLRELVVDRLGRIDQMLVTDRFFTFSNEQGSSEQNQPAGIANQLTDSAEVKKYFNSVVPVILLQGSVEVTHIDAQTQKPVLSRAAGVTIIGCDDAFWKLGDIAPAKLPGENEIVLNQPLAEELKADTNTKVTLRLPKVRAVPGDSLFGRKGDNIEGVTGLRVASIIPATSLGRFGMHPSQQLPKNVYVPLSVLQAAIKQPGKANGLLVSSSDKYHAAPKATDAVLADAMNPSLADRSLAIHKIRRAYTPEGSTEAKTAYEYFSLTSDRMLLDDDTARVALAAYKPFGASPVYTYMAKLIGKTPPVPLKKFEEDKSLPKVDIPYSTITAIDWSPAIGELITNAGEKIGPIAGDEVVLTDWAANNLGAKIGDTIYVTYFEPESTHGDPVEHTAQLKLKAIAKLTKPAKPYRLRTPAFFDTQPTLANDPDLTPQVPGVTDAESMSKWDAPFDIEAARIRPADDAYWEDYRTTPKAYVSLAEGRKLWQSRFGKTTSIRIPMQPGLTEEKLTALLLDEIHREKLPLGFEFRPIKRLSLDASKGTTSFAGLFVGFSFFIILAAVMLVMLLFRLNIEQRASQIGLMLAVGINRQQAARLLVTEGIIVAVLGGIIGIAVGVGYAWLMLVGLNTLWVKAVVTPFVKLFISPWTLLSGWAIGFVVCILSILWTVRGMRKVPASSLMAGRAQATSNLARKPGKTGPIVALVLLVSAMGLGIFAMQLGGDAQAGAFFGSGFAVLAAALIWIRARLAGARGNLIGTLPLPRLAARNAARNPGRSTLTIGLVASAAFLIVGIGAFRVDPSLRGAGGFNLIAESDLPIFGDLNTPEGRFKLGFSDAEEKMLAQDAIVPLRVQPGDDASCLNLYQPQQPRVVGVTSRMVDHFQKPGSLQFAWAESAAKTEAEKANPWVLLDTPVENDTIPVVLDAATAMYSMHLFVMQGAGTVFEIPGPDGPIKLKIVGLLSNSIFQGQLLISEANFKRLFPAVSGYRMFLVNAAGTGGAENSIEKTSAMLESRLGEYGLDVETTHARLENLLAVQNTYLSTFQSLGALGLLLGTFGLATVQLRSVLERRGELALMRAAGFRKSRLASMVMLENAVLLIAGLAAGTLAAAVAVLPHIIKGGASFQFGSLAGMLIAVLVVGLIAGFGAVISVLRAPLLESLRAK